MRVFSKDRPTPAVAPDAQSGEAQAPRAMSRPRSGNVIMETLGEINVGSRKASRKNESPSVSRLPSVTIPAGERLAPLARVGEALSSGVDVHMLRKVPGLLSKMGYIDDGLLQPLAYKSTNRNGGNKVKVGSRTFFTRTIRTEDDKGTPVDLDIVAELGFIDADERKPKRRAFFPLKADLTPDMSNPLINAGKGRWVADNALLKGSKKNWLRTDAFDTLVKKGSRPGVHQIGDREFCSAYILTGPKRSDQSKPLMIERIRGATAQADRYSLLNADMSEGDQVQLVDGRDADPFIAVILERIEGMGWHDKKATGLASAAAINAYHGGASVADAVALSVSLLVGTTADAAAIDEDTYAAAGASAGIMLRHGGAKHLATRVAEAVVASRSADARNADAVFREPLAQKPGIARRDAMLRLAYQEAETRIEAMKQRVMQMDRHAIGPDLSAVNAAARELFIEKKSGSKRLEDIARKAARTRVAGLEGNVRTLQKKTDEAQKTLALKKAAVLDLEAALAPRKPGTARNLTGWISSILPSRSGNVNNESAVDKSMSARRYELEAARIARATAQTHYDSLSASLSASTTALRSVSDDREERYAVAIKALLAANEAAPNRQTAAVIAARAASETFHAPGDERKAKCAAASAHLAILGGASETEAFAAAHLLAEKLDSTDAANYDDDDLVAMQVAYAQTACPKHAVSMRERGVSAVAGAASAAIVTLGQQMADAAAAAMLIAADTSDAKPSLTRTKSPAMPLFYHGPVPKLPVPARLRALPEQYEPVQSAFDYTRSKPVEDSRFARIRQFDNLDITGGPSTTSYIVEMDGPKGPVWTDFAYSANVNQLYGEISIAPRNATPQQHAAKATAVVAYNGVTGKWDSFEQRALDLSAKTVEILTKIETMVTSRDDMMGLTRLPYKAAESGFVRNIIEPAKKSAQLDAQRLANGMISLVEFESRMSKHFSDLAISIEGDRSRKKAIIRHQIDSVARIVSGAMGVSLGGARVAAAF